MAALPTFWENWDGDESMNNVEKNENEEINFLKDPREEMTYARRFALDHLDSKWYNPGGRIHILDNEDEQQRELLLLVREEDEEEQGSLVRCKERLRIFYPICTYVILGKSMGVL